MLRTGKEYISAIENNDFRVWFEGKQVHPLSVPKFRLQAAAIADYYQHHHEDAVNATGEKGDAYSTTLLMSHTAVDLRRKADSYYSLAQNYLGILGRAPDYINSVVSSWAGTPEAFGKFGPNVVKFYEEMKAKDLFVTHSTSVLRGGKNPGIRVVRESDAGIYLSGARAMATSAALCDEVMIAPTRVADNEPDKAIVAVLPVQASGLNIVCRNNFDSLSLLGQYFDESDAIILLDNVFVPWERVFVYRDLEIYNSFVRKTGTSPACTLQTNARAIAKLETLLDLIKVWMQITRPNEALTLVASQGLRDLNILQALQSESLRLAQRFGNLMQPNSEKIETAKVFFMERYAHLVHALKCSMGGELFYPFKARDMGAQVINELCAQWDIAEGDLHKKQNVSMLLFDLVLSTFGSRHELYEQYFAGLPARVFSGYWNSYSTRPVNPKLQDKLNQTEHLSARYFPDSSPRPVGSIHQEPISRGLGEAEFSF
ncbi:MAG: hypothetical protein JST16_00035 [Bdellovibrionales bacterium]|nr:hypothetical protein [Bdellovibrionales bacterium]